MGGRFLLVASAMLMGLPRRGAYRRSLDLTMQSDDKHVVTSRMKEERDKVPVSPHEMFGHASSNTTRLRFSFSEPVSTALAQRTNSTDSQKQQTSAERAASFETEWEIYMQEPVVQRFWKSSVKKIDASDEMLDKLDVIFDRLVPGTTVTVGEVFRTLRSEGCPLWILGGAVRDLVAGGDASDVDTAALCPTERIQEIARSHGWLHNAYHKYQYFSIGTPHHDEGVEGKHISAGYRSPFIQEWSVNMLLYAESVGKIIDPTGHGFRDATDKVLRPAVPYEDVYENATGRYVSRWSLWEAWVDAQRPPSLARHVRYLKMRARGWEPHSDCVTFFMANQYVIASEIENMNEPLGTKVSFGRQSQILWPIGTLKFIAEMVAKAKGAENKRKTAYKYLSSIEEDLDLYFQEHRRGGRGACKGYGIVESLAKDITRQTRATQVIADGFENHCAHPSDAARNVMKKSSGDFASTCAAVRQYIREM